MTEMNHKGYLARVEFGEEDRLNVCEKSGRKPQHKLADLLAKCNHGEPIPQEITEWGNMQPTGKEVW